MHEILLPFRVYQIRIISFTWLVISFSLILPKYWTVILQTDRLNCDSNRVLINRLIKIYKLS